MYTDAYNMSFAIIKTGGKQYRVMPGQTIKIEKLAPAAGSKTVVFDEVLLVDDGQNTKIGKQAADTRVTGTIISDGRAKKVTVIHYKNKVRYFKKQGHRQPFSEVKIEEIK